MIKPRVYLDTTVPSALLDGRAPERQEETRAAWEVLASQYEGVVSELVDHEIDNTPDPERRLRLQSLVAALPRLTETDPARELAQAYVAEGLFPERYMNDAKHVAIAVLHSVPILASWNFTHLVKRRIRLQINLVNVLRGYGPIEIVSPNEL